MLPRHSCLLYDERFTCVTIMVYFDLESSVYLSAMLIHFFIHNTVPHTEWAVDKCHTDLTCYVMVIRRDRLMFSEIC